MQVSSGENESSIDSICSATEYTAMMDSLREDFSQKLKVTEDHRQERSTQSNCYHKDQLLNDENPRLPPEVRDQEEEEEEEFSFVCANPSGPLISAEDIFQNGMIRPIYTLCSRDDLLFAEDVRIKAKTSTPLMFMEERNETEGPCCVWSGGHTGSRNQQPCKKRSFTRFSKPRRIREFVLPSSRLLGNDAFILFNQKYYSSKHPTEAGTTTSKNVLDQEKKKELMRRMLSSSTHKLNLFLRNRAIQGGDKQKSYLP
ncbi:DUF1645 FAMILY PROTEIN [Salix purpurea]|uniref:DUF1645 FAMILY PROTEIN n=1 Tax=Salix purpurea TaxID=77065 RepID=A0A9Q0UK65_SALPP|nr:DUF1645 FAMILY PROTEIN [Salix purpurea]